ncbi:restriction endonuclease subunit S [Mucilaginibacter sp. cycad4]|uniref:restriction endonuclease subunit S n=1 Tax=Mucilaginibacter sp. cycad4 TaxID=3342096 RepID=UPI002AAC2ABB|nr:restriction endonuclease subunit S [Mucilaginibacter gossypii]WPV00586.1 restriction endonuclease subunit S [Mucilaginibacter gossypii]
MGMYNYKESGIEWIGEVPQHWILKKVKHTTYVKGRIGWQGLRSEEFLEVGDSYVVTGTDFNDGQINWTTCYQITKARYDEDPYIQLKENDLLITKDGTIGKIALVKNIPSIATLNSGVFVTRPISGDYITSFFYWVLQSDIFTSFINHNKSGSTILHLYQNVFNEFKFPCPSIPEQHSISQYLNHKTELIDKLIGGKEKLLQLLNEERITTITQSVTKGLNSTTKMINSWVEWLGEIPEHWTVKKIKYVANLKSGDTITSEFITEEGAYPVYGGNGLRGYYERYNMDGDYILIGRQGALCGNINYASNKFWASEHAIVCYLNKEYDWIWLGNLLTVMNLNQYSQSAAQPGLAVEKIKNLSIPVPNYDEQRRIGEFITQECYRIDRLMQKIKKEVEHLKEYKTALISEVVTGKVDIRDEVNVFS